MGVKTFKRTDLNDGENLFPFLLQNLFIPPTISETEILIQSGNDNETEWKQDISSIDNSFAIILPNETAVNQESCDFCIFCELGGREKFVVFVDAKSVNEAEVDPNKKFCKEHFATPPYRQYLRMRDRIARISSNDLQNDNGFLRALVEDRYLYIYATT